MTEEQLRQLSDEVGADRSLLVLCTAFHGSAETADALWMIEGKARNQLKTPEVLAKKEAAELWCRRASEHTAQHAGKPWKYALVPHDVVDENMSLDFLVRAGTAT